MHLYARACVHTHVFNYVYTHVVFTFNTAHTGGGETLTPSWSNR